MGGSCSKPSNASDQAILERKKGIQCLQGLQLLAVPVCMLTKCLIKPTAAMGLAVLVATHVSRALLVPAAAPHKRLSASCTGSP
jgi:hypothetical protein